MDKNVKIVICLILFERKNKNYHNQAKINAYNTDNYYSIDNKTKLMIFAILTGMIGPSHVGWFGCFIGILSLYYV